MYSRQVSISRGILNPNKYWAVPWRWALQNLLTRARTEKTSQFYLSAEEARKDLQDVTRSCSKETLGWLCENLQALWTDS